MKLTQMIVTCNCHYFKSTLPVTKNSIKNLTIRNKTFKRLENFYEKHFSNQVKY